MAEDEVEGFDSWEEQEDSGMLDKRIGELQIDITASQDIKGSKLNTVVVKEISDRTEYTPQVRILQRDKNSQDTQPDDNKRIVGNVHSKNDKSLNNKPPSKSLEEREAEYAEARFKIFGDEPPVVESDEELEFVEKRPVSLIIKSDQLCGNEVIRQPRGPDGTRGFQLNR